MIGALKGKPEILSSNSLIIMCSGVGYKVCVPAKVITNSLKADENFFLFIHTHVKEDCLELYGFLVKEDLVLFELLINVSGVGPKTALLIMDKGEKEIREAIISSDVEFFTAIPRIGRKNSQKIIIELKSKIGSLTELDLSENGDNKIKEVLEALCSMGFRKFEIYDVLKTIQTKDKTTEDLIKEVLKAIGGKAKK